MDVARAKKFWIQSESDPRWDFVGEGVCTRFDTPKELSDWITKKKEELGDQPRDLKIGYY